MTMSQLATDIMTAIDDGIPEQESPDIADAIAAHLIGLGYPAHPADTITERQNTLEETVQHELTLLADDTEQIVVYGLAIEVRPVHGPTFVRIIGSDDASPLHLAGIFASAARRVLREAGR